MSEITKADLSEWQAATDAYLAPHTDAIQLVRHDIAFTRFTIVALEAMPRLLTAFRVAIDERNRYHERLDAIENGVGLIDGMVPHCNCPSVARDAIK